MLGQSPSLGCAVVETLACVALALLSAALLPAARRGIIDSGLLPYLKLGVRVAITIAAMAALFSAILYAGLRIDHFGIYAGAAVGTVFVGTGFWWLAAPKRIRRTLFGAPLCAAIICMLDYLNSPKHSAPLILGIVAIATVIILVMYAERKYGDRGTADR